MALLVTRVCTDTRAHWHSHTCTNTHVDTGYTSGCAVLHKGTHMQ